jgi:hypothetical protein
VLDKEAVIVLRIEIAHSLQRPVVLPNRQVKGNTKKETLHSGKLALEQNCAACCSQMAAQPRHDRQEQTPLYKNVAKGKKDEKKKKKKKKNKKKNQRKMTMPNLGP